MADEVMTEKEAADDLNLSLPTLERRLHAGTIPIVTFGLQMLRRKETLAVERWAHARRWRSTVVAELVMNGPPAGEG